MSKTAGSTAGSAGQAPTSVVGAIRRGILENELVPGQRLVETELARLLGASRGAVRSALTDLIHEGLVERIPNLGARVRVVGLKEALQIAEVRMVIESLCAATAAARITDSEIAALRNLGGQLEAQAAMGDPSGFATVSHGIFETITRISDQPIIHEVLARLRARNARHRYRLTYRLGRAKVSLPFWLERIETICSRDPEAARLAVRRHSENVQAAMRDLALEDNPFTNLYVNVGAK